MGDYSRPLIELAARMAYHTLSGQSPARMLQGMTWFPYPQQRTEGQDDFPYVQMSQVTGGEVYRPGARPGLIQPSLIVTIEIANKRDANNGHPELMAWVEKAMDALETDTTGVVNPNLGGTRRPFDMQITQSLALDASLTTVLTITIEPRIIERGDRRL